MTGMTPDGVLVIGMALGLLIGLVVSMALYLTKGGGGK